MFESVEKLLKEHDQLQLLKCYKEIDGSDKEKLLKNISSLDFATVNGLFIYLISLNIVINKVLH